MTTQRLACPICLGPTGVLTLNNRATNKRTMMVHCEHCCWGIIMIVHHDERMRMTVSLDEIQGCGECFACKHGLQINTDGWYLSARQTALLMALKHVGLRSLSRSRHATESP